MTETREEIEAQIRLATHGVAQAVEQRQTKSGIKDAVAQYWIDQLLTRGRVLRYQLLTDPSTRDCRLNSRQLRGNLKELEAVRTDVMQRIEREQLAWLVQQPPHRFVALPADSRKLSLSVPMAVKLMYCQYWL